MRLKHARDRALRVEQALEVDAWEIAHLGSCNLGKPLGTLPLNWENGFGKILISFQRPFL